MRLTDFLVPEHIVVPLPAETVRDAVLGLVKKLIASGAVPHPEKLERLTTEERIRDVIHVGDHVLLPHMRTEAVDRLVVALGVAPELLRVTPGGAEETARVVVLVLAPPSAANQYLQMVAAIARTLRHDSVVAKLGSASSSEEVLRIPELQELVLQPRLSVRDVMAQRVYRVYPDTPVRELLDLMHRHGLKAVPVVGEKREVLGLVTERDLLRHLMPRILRAGDTGDGEGERTGEIPVRDIMSRSVMCISEDQGLAEVASIMINKDVERLPVVSEGKLTGFLTRSDIIRKLFGS